MGCRRIPEGFATRIPNRDCVLSIRSKARLLIHNDGLGVIEIAGIDNESRGPVVPGGADGPVQKPRPNTVPNVLGQQSKIGEFHFIILSVVQFYISCRFSAAIQRINMYFFV